MSFETPEYRANGDGFGALLLLEASASSKCIARETSVEKETGSVPMGVGVTPDTNPLSG